MGRSTSQSKFLSLVLRHEPESIGLTLDAAGWVSVELLLNALAKHGRPLSREELVELVRSNDKQRFAFNPEASMIRASQGHSVEVELGYEATTPPPVLFHGTIERFVTSIASQGLLKGERQHVHLSAGPELAALVAKRRGEPVILRVAAEAMAREGHAFFVSANGVWLTDHVAARFLSGAGLPG